jgi:hypothetical protein
MSATAASTVRELRGEHHEQRKLPNTILEPLLPVIP